jgi:hypothetical protein
VQKADGDTLADATERALIQDLDLPPNGFLRDRTLEGLEYVLRARRELRHQQGVQRILVRL